MIGCGVSRMSNAPRTPPPPPPPHWVPTLFAGGRALRPLVGVGYYVRRTRNLLAFPPGLVMIAGNQNAKRPQSLSVVGWGCGGFGAPPKSAVVPNCPADRALHLRATFPGCWNGPPPQKAQQKAPQPKR